MPLRQAVGGVLRSGRASFSRRRCHSGTCRRTRNPSRSRGIGRDISGRESIEFALHVFPAYLPQCPIRGRADEINRILLKPSEIIDCRPSFRADPLLIDVDDHGVTVQGLQCVLQIGRVERRVDDGIATALEVRGRLGLGPGDADCATGAAPCPTSPSTPAPWARRSGGIHLS